MMPLAFAVLLATSTNPSVLTVPIKTPYDFTSTTSVRQYLLDQGASDRALYIAAWESEFEFDARGDMDILCKNKNSPFYGEPIAARGVFQITRCYHPEVSDKQADDVVWSAAWALPRIEDKATCLREWTTCGWWYH